MTSSSAGIIEFSVLSVEVAIWSAAASLASRLSLRLCFCDFKWISICALPVMYRSQSSHLNSCEQNNILRPGLHIFAKPIARQTQHWVLKKHFFSAVWKCKIILDWKFLWKLCYILVVKCYKFFCENLVHTMYVPNKREIKRYIVEQTWIELWLK